MAVGNAVVNTAQFKPLTIAEWSTPLKERVEQHTAMSSVLSELLSDADEYQRYIDQNPDSEIARKYNDYVSEIEAQSDNLLKSGVTPQILAQLNNLRRKYNESVKPVKKAVTTYQDIMNQRAKYNDLIGAQDIDVNYILEHPEYTKEQDSKNYSTSNDIYKSSSMIFGGLTGFNQKPTVEPASYPGYITITTPQSYEQKDIINAITNPDDESVPEELRKAVQQIRSRYNYDQLSDKDKEAFNYAVTQGAYSTIKPPKVTTQQAASATRGGGGNKKPGLTQTYAGFYDTPTDNGDIIYKKGEKYYDITDDGNGNYYSIPVTRDVTINGIEYTPDPADPGKLIVRTPESKEQYVGTYSSATNKKGVTQGFSQHQDNNVPSDYRQVSFQDLSQIDRFKDTANNIQAKIRGQVERVLKARNSKYQFNAKDVVIYINDDGSILFQIKNPDYRPPSNGSTKTTQSTVATQSTTTTQTNTTTNTNSSTQQSTVPGTTNSTRGL